MRDNYFPVHVRETYMMKKRKNSKQFNKQFKKQFFTVKSGIIIVLTLLIVLFLGFFGLHQKKQADRYRETIKELSSEVKTIKETNKALEEEKENASSDDFKERIAREKLGLVDKDEYLVKESDSGEETGNKDDEEKTGDSDNLGNGTQEDQ